MIFVSNQPVAGINTAQTAIDFIVNEVSRSAAVRRSSNICAAIPRSIFVARSHILTGTANACRVSLLVHARLATARLDQLSLLSTISVSTPDFKPNHPVAGEYIAQAAIDLGVSLHTNTTTQETHYQHSKSSGFDINPTSISYQKSTSTTHSNGTSNQAAASQVGSLGGNVEIQAGGTYRQTGSDVLTPSGDINIAAKRVEITESRETNQLHTETQTKTISLSVGVSNAATALASNTANMAQAAGNTSSSRAKALAAAAVALDVLNNGKTALDALANPNMGSGKDATSINITVSSSKSESKTDITSDTARGSTLAAGGNVSIKATALQQAQDDRGSSDILIQGSKIDAGKNVTLKADDAIQLQASKDTSSERSTNTSSGMSFGVSVGKETGVTIGPAPGGSISASKSNINSNFNSVGTQSGIAAGDGGFQVNVAGNTTLTGGKITSTDKAATAVRHEAVEGQSAPSATGLNTFTTGGTLTTTDLTNTASYKASATSMSVGTGGVLMRIGRDFEAFSAYSRHNICA